MQAIVLCIPCCCSCVRSVQWWGVRLSVCCGKVITDYTDRCTNDAIKLVGQHLRCMLLFVQNRSMRLEEKLVLVHIIPIPFHLLQMSGLSQWYRDASPSLFAVGTQFCSTGGHQTQPPPIVCSLYCGTHTAIRMYCVTTQLCNTVCCTATKCLYTTLPTPALPIFVLPVAGCE